MIRLRVALLGLAYATLSATVGPARASEYTVLYSFKGGSDGAGPDAADGATLVDIGGTLYGTTWFGGASGYGTVFAIDPTTGAERSVYAFRSDENVQLPSGLIEAGGLLYGTGESTISVGGSVFSVDPATGSEHVVYTFPLGRHAAMVHGGGSEFGVTPTFGKLLFGTTGRGGAHDMGSVFSIVPSTGAERVRYSFGDAAGDGSYPRSDLLNIAGTLYGTTILGGAFGVGPVYSFAPATGTLTILHSFGSGSDGAWPGPHLTRIGSTLYGITEDGGASGAGTVFSLDLATNTETVLHSFGAAGDGFQPVGSVLHVGQLLYGTTAGGGDSTWGTIFSLNLVARKERVVHSFQASENGYGGYTAVLTHIGSTLYGTTETGGNAGCESGCGTVFALTP